MQRQPSGERTVLSTNCIEIFECLFAKNELQFKKNAKCNIDLNVKAKTEYFKKQCSFCFVFVTINL